MAKKANHFWIEPDELARKGFDFCSLEAQGLWLKVMCILHGSERYGHLTRDGKSVSDEQAARRCGLDVEKWIVLRDELLDFGVLKRSGDGILYSPELIAQAEWRARTAKRQKDFQDKKKDSKKEEKYNGTYNANITPDITPKSLPNFKPLNTTFSSSNEKEKGGGSHANAKPPPAADSSRQWIELTAGEKKMSKIVFAEHLQKLYPERDVKHIARKLKVFCDNNAKDFALERLKGWVIGEGATITEAEFLEAFGSEIETNESDLRREKIDNCSKCDNNGYIKIGDGVKICKHKEK